MSHEQKHLSTRITVFMRFINFFQRQIQVARVFGIPVRIDYRWFFVFGITLWLIASVFAQGSERIERLGTAGGWAVAITTTLLMFLSVFGHELSHALVGRTEGIETEEIVLHPFGGLARLRREPDNPRAEFRIAVAGPASSFIFAMVAFAASALANLAGLYTIRTMFVIVGSWNLMLAVFNILPGYPLDGGRVLRAFLWKRTGQLEEATRVASLGGQLIGGALVVFGGYFYLWLNDPFMGLWLALVGFFLFDAARAVVRRPARLRTAGDAMTAPVSVEPDATVSHFIDNVLPVHRQEAVAVAHASQLHGILTLRDLKQLPRELWHKTLVRDVMRPVAPELFVEPRTPLERAERLMNENGAGALAVINDAGELVGLLLRGRVKRRVKVRA